MASGATGAEFSVLTLFPGHWGNALRATTSSETVTGSSCCEVPTNEGEGSCTDASTLS